MGGVGWGCTLCLGNGPRFLASTFLEPCHRPFRKGAMGGVQPVPLESLSGLPRCGTAKTTGALQKDPLPPPPHSSSAGPEEIQQGSIRAL